ncbi:MAG: methyltransferase [Bacteroidaceae bacterium]|nr:methyltransferase [Bacteroidaceae bacterium]
MADFEMIAKTFQGLESVLAQELRELGAGNVQMGHRMVSFTGDQEMLYRANFCLRTAIRILKPIKHFRATTADEVYDAVKAIDWSDYLSLDTSFAVDSVVFSTEFRHSKFVAYKVKDAIVDQFREQTGERPNIHITNPDIQLHIHIAEYDCTLSLDSSGESLHRRGYRQESVEAPLNEVLAAGIILMTGWRGECDFIDPMCGSGTLPIEAALIARGIYPGIYRKEYAFEKWRDFDRELFDSIYEDDSHERPFDHHIYGYDINRGAVAIATNNVKAAGLSREITIEQRDIADFVQPEQRAILVTNPPYGERISTPDLLGLYKTIGERLKHQFVGNDAWVLSYREECFDKIGLKPSLRVPLFNGSLECELRKYQMFTGKFNEMRADGHDIKTAQERRLMADHKRFKQHREFRERLDDSPELRLRDRHEERRNAFSRRDAGDGEYRQRFTERSDQPPRRPSSRNPFAPHDDSDRHPRRSDRFEERRTSRRDDDRSRRPFRDESRSYGHPRQNRHDQGRPGRKNYGQDYGNDED